MSKRIDISKKRSRVKHLKSKLESKIESNSKKLHYQVIFLSIIVMLLLSSFVLIFKPSILGFGIIENKESIKQNQETPTEDDDIIIDPIIEDSKKDTKIKDIINQKNIENTVATADLSTCKAINQELLDKIDLLSDQILSCEKSLVNSKDSVEIEKQKCNLRIQDLDHDIDDLQGRLSTIESEKDKIISDLQSDLDKYKNDYNRLLESSAKNICCKQKIDNPSINSYAVQSGKIYCYQDGENELIC